MFENLWQNTCVGFSLLIKLQSWACTFTEKETQLFCGIFKNCFFMEHLLSLLLKFRDTKQLRKRQESVNYIWKNPVLKKLLEDIRWSRSQECSIIILWQNVSRIFEYWEFIFIGIYNCIYFQWTSPDQRNNLCNSICGKLSIWVPLSFEFNVRLVALYNRFFFYVWKALYARSCSTKGAAHTSFIWR